MDDSAVTLRQVDVTFAMRNVSFGGTGIDSEGKIDIDVPVGRIAFRLQRGRASFPSFPIQWTRKNGEDFEPIAQPGAATVKRLDALNAEIEIASSTPGEEFSFFVIVQTLAGKFFGTDPTIVTMRPGGGSGR